MAKQRYINTRMWRDSYFQNLDPSEKLMFVYCLSNPDTSICGIYEIPLKIIAIDTGFDVEMTNKILERFERDDKIKYRDGWIAIKNFIKHQSLNPKIMKGITTELKKAPPELVKWVLSGKPIHSLFDLNSNINTNSNTNSNRGMKKPTIAEIDEYCKEKGYNVNPEKFWNYYESVGWIVGKSRKPMKSWKAAIYNTWAGNESNVKKVLREAGIDN